MVQKHFKIEGTPTLQDLIRRNNFAISFDLKEAYNHVSVHPTFQNLLGIQFMGTTYTYRGIPLCSESFYSNNEKMCNGNPGNLEDQMCGILG
jgi:hypothetical protein